MSAIALGALADVTGGQLVGESVPLQTLAIDSREVKTGDLFAALSGQRVDGHDFAPDSSISDTDPEQWQDECIGGPYSEHDLAAEQQHAFENS